MAESNLELTYNPEPNLAPAKSLVDAREKRPEQNTKPLTEFLTGRFEYFHKLEEHFWRNFYSECELNALMVEGKQLVRRSMYGKGWVVYGRIEDTGQANVRMTNLMRFFTDNILVKWVQSQADLVAREGRDTDQAEGASRAADTIIEHYEQRWFTPVFKQHEAKDAYITGNYFRRLYYCESEKTRARRTLTEQVPMGGGGTATCTDCNHVADINEFRPQGGGAAIPNEGQGLSQPMAPAAPPGGGGLSCPACGSSQVLAEEVPEISVTSVVGHEEYDTGDIKCESVSVYHLRWELTGPIEESSWVLYQRRVRRDDLYGKFRGALKFDRSGTDFGLDALDTLARTGMSGSGQMKSWTSDGGSHLNEYVDLAELWLLPEAYGHIVLKEPVETLDGGSIPAGPLIDAFPDGLCCLSTNRFKTILALYNEDHRDFWVSGQYHVKSTSGVGDGISDMIEAQRQYNVGTSQIWANIRASATPALLYNQSLITGDKAAQLGKPQSVIPVDMGRAPDTARLSDTVQSIMPGTVPGHALQYVFQHLKEVLQLTAHTTEFSSGLPGVNNTTATGAQIAASNAQSLHSPQLQIRADVDRRTMQKALKLFKRFCGDERYMQMAGKRGKQDGVWLGAASIPNDITIEVVPESHLPQSGLEKRERIKEFVAFFGGVEGLAMAQQANPALVNELIRNYDIDLEVTDFSGASMLGRRRIEQLKKALPMVEQGLQQVDPGMLAMMQATGMQPEVLGGTLLLNVLDPKPDIRETSHEAAVLYYQEWLTTDEGLDAMPFLREAVKALIDQHMQFAAMGLPVAAGLAPPPIGADGLPLGAPKTDANGNPMQPPPQPGVGGVDSGADAGSGSGSQPSPQKKGKSQAEDQTQQTTPDRIKQSAGPNLRPSAQPA